MTGDGAATSYAVSGFNISDSPVGTYDTRRDRMLVHYRDTVFIVDLQNPGAGATSFSLTQISPDNSDGVFDYVEDTDQIIAWHPSNGKTVHFLDAGNIAAGWTSSSTSTLTPPSPVKSPYNKYRYIPGTGCLIGVGDDDQLAWAYRIP